MPTNVQHTCRSCFTWGHIRGTERRLWRCWCCFFHTTEPFDLHRVHFFECSAKPPNSAVTRYFEDCFGERRDTLYHGGRQRLRCSQGPAAVILGTLAAASRLNTGPRASMGMGKARRPQWNSMKFPYVKMSDLQKRTKMLKRWIWKHGGYTMEHRIIVLPVLPDLFRKSLRCWAQAVMFAFNSYGYLPAYSKAPQTCRSACLTLSNMRCHAFPQKILNWKSDESDGRETERERERVLVDAEIGRVDLAHWQIKEVL